MRVTRKQLRRIIRETWADDDRDFSAPPGEEDYYAPGGEGEQVTDTQLKRGWGSWLEERGLEFEDLDDLALAAGAPNRTWLDSIPPHDGFIGPLDVGVWVKDIQAAKEILSTRAGDYSSSPHGKKMNEGVDPRGLKTYLKSLGVKRSFGNLTDVLSTVFNEFEGDAVDMKEEVEIVNGIRDDNGQAINWPIEVYQDIYGLYKKHRRGFRAQRRW
tara:strand:- start:10628 stop:11269 length:642 start_codon:yes stop_codon:yes gene_type:complete